MGIDQDQLIKIRHNNKTPIMLRLVATVAAAASVINAGCWPEINSDGFATKYGHFDCTNEYGQSSYICHVMDAFKSPYHTGGRKLMNVKNDLDTEVELFWVDREGVPQRKAYIQPGDVHSRYSWVGNTWIVMVRGFECSASYIDVHGIHAAFKVQDTNNDEFTAWIDNDTHYQFKS